MQNQSGGSGQKGSPEKYSQSDAEEGRDIDEYDLYFGESAVTEQAEEKPKQPGPLSRRPSFASSIPALVLAIIFLLCTFPLNNYFFPGSLWASRDAVFVKHQYWRLLVAVFTHADAVHLLSNMPLFFFFGLFLYDYFGFLVFPLVSLAIGVSANAVTLYFYPGAVRLVGASGMLYGMVSLWLVLYIYHDTGHTIPVRIFRAAGFTLIVLFPSTYNPSTSYLAHAAGFLIGIFSALAILPFTRVRVKKSS